MTLRQSQRQQLREETYDVRKYYTDKMTDAYRFKDEWLIKPKQDDQLREEK